MTWDEANRDWTECSLMVEPRSGVAHAIGGRHRATDRSGPRGSRSDYRHWDEANLNHVPDDERTGDSADWMARTYTLICGRCGRNHAFTATRLGELWRRLDVPSKHGVVIADLGVDL
ncbi:MAG: hypothetical protein ACRDRG_20305 [Pseudonocardiaceae bacterium]